MRSMIDEVQNNVARITTATVTVKVIRIGSKQMTLSVFRQLPVHDIFDQYGDLVAQPWGWVNYDRCTTGLSRKPFVFSLDEQLWRYNLFEYAEFHVEKTMGGTGYQIRNRGVYQAEDDGIDWEFDARSDAETYLNRRAESIRRLQYVDQLFIAV